MQDQFSDLTWADPHGEAVMSTQYQARWDNLVQMRDRVCLLGMALLQATWIQSEEKHFRIHFPDGSTWLLSLIHI